ncbi:MAG: TlpA family protein disulfide reductase [Planctomycetes bacterium]|nr:TlpA family protein disulfide reductase [Planctomycetota bacterium]
MRLARAMALRDGGNVDGAEKALRELVDNAGDDINALVEATTMLGELLVDAGKKDAAVELLTSTGEARSEVRGLKEHLAGIAASYELIGTEPVAIDEEDIAGKPIQLGDYKGKVVLLDFWATWCGPCVAELPNVLAAYEKYHGHGFEIVGISLDKDRGAFDKFIADRKMTWRHHFDGKGWQNVVAQAYGVRSIPATYLIGPDGKIAAVGLRGEQLERRLARFYPAGKPAAAPAKGK